MVIDKYKTEYKYNEPKQYTDISKHRRKEKKKTNSNTETANAG
jgi:hypothetical protein